MGIANDGRPNKVLAESVEDAIQTARTHGRRRAADVMNARGVPFSVAVRVLAEPSRRRSNNTI
jgi:hypothetical protein